MKRQLKSPTYVGGTGTFALLLFAVGCVSLDKPENVKSCASSAEGCSDDPTPTSRDAAVAIDGSKTPSDGLGPDVLTMQDTSAENRDGLVVLDVGSDRLAVSDVVDALVRTDSVQSIVDTGASDWLLLDLQQPLDLIATSDLPATPDLPVSPDLPLIRDLPVMLDLPTQELPGPDLADAGSDLAGDALDARDLLPDTVADLGPDQVQSDGQTGNCITQIISNGYKAGTAPACSVCNDGNGNSLASKCTGMLDCLGPPNSSADFSYCLNHVSGSSRVADCVTALTKAGCPDGY